VLFAAPTQAAPFESLPAEHGHAYPLSDGLRYVLLNRAPGVIRVLDTRTERGVDVTVRDKCTARGATANWGLVGCDDDRHPWLMRLSTRELAPHAMEINEGGQWNGIGRHWLVGGYHHNRPVVVYGAWRPGAQGGYSGDGFESPRFDLDDPKLRPISAQHWIFDRDGDGVLKDLRKARSEDKRLVLDRGRKRVVLSGCRDMCSNGSLSGGVATWSEPRVVRAYVERTGRRYAFPTPDPFAQAVVHTRTHVLFAHGAGPHPPKVYWGRLTP
jgi:hypothetical protein